MKNKKKRISQLGSYKNCNYQVLEKAMRSLKEVNRQLVVAIRQ
jgi:hypothetical protein